MPLPHFVADLPTVHASGQAHVAGQQNEARAGLHQAQRRRPAFRLQHPVAEVVQQLGRQLAYLPFVLDQQDCPAGAGH